jgi:hypothetical protein
MIIEHDPTKSTGEHRAFVLTYELDENSQLHEGHVAVNAIAASLRSRFDESKDTEMPTTLQSPMEEFLAVGMDKYVSFLQRSCGEKARGGPLTVPVETLMSELHGQYICDSFIAYRDKSPVDIGNEMRGSMGNLSALVRAMEAVVADRMAFQLEAAPELSIAPVLPKKRTPLGFGRHLMDTHKP